MTYRSFVCSQDYLDELINITEAQQDKKPEGRGVMLTTYTFHSFASCGKNSVVVLFETETRYAE